MTRDLYNLALLARLMVLLRQILFNLAITVIAEVILKRFSAQQKSAPQLPQQWQKRQTKQGMAVQHHQLRKQIQALQVSCHLHPPLWL